MSAISISVLGPFWNPAPGRKVIAVLTRAALDCSADPAEAEWAIRSVAGYIAPLKMWEDIERPWGDACREFNIPYFHMRKLRGWIGKDKAELCVRRFAKIIEESELQAIGSAVLEEDWHKPDWGPRNLSRLSTPYEQCLDLAFKLIGEYCKNDLSGEQTAIVCDPDEKEHKIEAAFERKQAEYPCLLSVAITKSENCIPLQCADLGAGMLRKSWGSIARGGEGSAGLVFGALPTGKGTHRRTSFLVVEAGRRDGKGCLGR